MHRRKRLNLGSMMIVQSDLAHFPTIIWDIFDIYHWLLFDVFCQTVYL
jgi:hypothetical protein